MSSKSRAAEICREVGSLWRSPRESLAARIVLLVFCSTLLTSLAVTALSSRSLERVVREQVEKSFPRALAAVDQQLRRWYGEAEKDLASFARSSVVTRYAEQHRRDSEPPEPHSSDEVRAYLGFLVERLPHYTAFFLLDPDGRPAVWTGDAPELSGAARRELASVRRAHAGRVVGFRGRWVQIVSAPVPQDGSASGWSLHAMLEVERLETLLQSPLAGESAELFMIDETGAYATPASGRTLGQVFGSALSPDADAPSVAKYRDDLGREVFGASLRIPALGWTLVLEEPASAYLAPVRVARWRMLAVNVITSLLFGFGALWIAVSIVRPIRALCAGTKRIAEGHPHVGIPERPGGDELDVLVRTFNRMAGRLHRNRLELKQSRSKIQSTNAMLRAQNEELVRLNEALEQLSITDGLTKLYNHRYFQEHLTREISRVERSGDLLGLILIDIDNFKQLNDTWGHAAGDAVLRAVAEVMGAVTRGSDLLARYGGEEFALVPRQASLEGVVGTAEKIRLAIAELHPSIPDPSHSDGSRAIRVTVSIGVAVYKGNRAEFFNAADRALYHAKGAGKDCVIVED